MNKKVGSGITHLVGVLYISVINVVGGSRWSDGKCCSITVAF